MQWSKLDTKREKGGKREFCCLVIYLGEFPFRPSKHILCNYDVYMLWEEVTEKTCTHLFTWLTGRGTLKDPPWGSPKAPHLKIMRNRAQSRQSFSSFVEERKRSRSPPHSPVRLQVPSQPLKREGGKLSWGKKAARASQTCAHPNNWTAALGFWESFLVMPANGLWICDSAFLCLNH